MRGRSSCAFEGHQMPARLHLLPARSPRDLAYKVQDQEVLPRDESLQDVSLPPPVR